MNGEAINKKNVMNNEVYFYFFYRHVNVKTHNFVVFCPIFVSGVSQTEVTRHDA